ncbi:Putative amidoligase enzyme [Ectothiorhodospira magna]|uniref:Putative amidoligase enzyme n=1 Tax=Ectothiorhodospira magna TaxID=867345 RepID=A0A1H9D9V6_9GAMM|nr:amidoligase family protein [Ectothiorhodospira magna]SEQ09643.1 Putative amidoligase enzyme [Ectothiorhodospira magna]
MTIFAALPHDHTPDGHVRRVGVELEMAEISLDAIADIILDCFGGTPQRLSPFEQQVTETALGDFRLELDSRLLKRREYLDYLETMGITVDRDAEPGALERMVADVAGLIVPHEVVAPPIAHHLLPEMDRLRARLQAAGAKGTHTSLLHAFGLQLNLELASHDVQSILRHLQAFVLLNDWLLEAAQTDLSRRLTPFVEPFPSGWGERILQPDYAPDLPGLIDDYLTDNPTRNRPLDMLPLFAHLSPEQIKAAPVEHDLIRPRPTFHYRLPDCRIDEPDWNLSLPWNGWVAVEQLADDPQRLAVMAQAYLNQSQDNLVDKGRRWVAQVSDWLRSSP